MDTKRAELLLEKYAQNQCTPEEKRLVEDWYLHTYKKDIPALHYPDLESVDKKLRLRLPMVVRKKAVRSWKYGLTAAAVFLIVFSVAVYFYMNVSTRFVNDSSTAIMAEIEPGSNKAILTLADGRTVDLSEEKRGIVMEGTDLSYEDGTPLTEVQERARKHQNVVPYKLATPRGGQYQVTLPDGTKVWLNAASSLAYPSQFAGAKRIVELKGEAYFEVSKKSKPFIVKTANQEIEVLGTHFNVTAYDDEPDTRTTLLEGSVKVSTTDRISRLLSPAQQSVVSKDQKVISVRQVDPQTEIAWKNGDFVFENENIKSIMRKISRWYNIDIAYEGGSNPFHFSGVVSKARNLSAVLEMLESTEQIKFKIVPKDAHGTERRLIIML